MSTNTTLPDLGIAPIKATRPPAQRRRLGVLGGAILLAVVALAAPWLITSNLWMNVGIFALIASIATLGLQVVMGYAGQISLGHAAFMAIGAYVAAWLGVDLQLPFWIWLPGAALIAGGAGALFAPIAVRIRGLYLAVATIGLVFIGSYVWDTWSDFTGGISGRTAAPVVIAGQDLLDGIWIGDQRILTMYQAWWYFALILLVIVGVLVWNIKRSRLGRAMMAVRDRDVAAGVVGIAVTRTKTVAFAISSAFAGAAGALLTAFMGYFTPEQFSLQLSIDMITMLVIGGLGSIAGAILGAFFFYAVPEIVNWMSTFIPLISQSPKVEGGLTAPLVSMFVYGLLIVLVMLFEPKGLSALLKKPFAAWQKARERRKR